MIDSIYTLKKGLSTKILGFTDSQRRKPKN
jgi:hypothetical protein